MKKIILDTDIGDDIDDALALGLALSSPELKLIGITTVFGNTPARSQLARTILKTVGKEDVPVAIGCGASMSFKERAQFSKPLRQNPLGLYLNAVPLVQGECCLSEDQLPQVSSMHGVDFIIDTILQGAGDIEIVTIGSMTNIAIAMVKEPKIISKIPRIISMAGIFESKKEDKIDWNILCDPVASDIVTQSKVPIDFIGLDVTTKIPLLKKDIYLLRESNRPLVKLLVEALDLWIEKVNARNGVPMMHDPLTIAVLIEPDLVKWRRGKVTIDTKSDGVCDFIRFEESSNGPHRYAYHVEPERVISLWLERVLNK